VPGLVIGLAQSITLFLFASSSVEHYLASHGLPTFPLVPVSSSQAVVGAILGISLFKGANIRYNVLGGISLGWMATPLAAGVVAFFLLFFVDNVFDQQVSRTVQYRIDGVVRQELVQRGVEVEGLAELGPGVFTNAVKFKSDLEKIENFDSHQAGLVLELSRLGRWEVQHSVIANDVDKHWLSPGQVEAMRSLTGQRFDHFWRLKAALGNASEEWKLKPDTTVNKQTNKDLKKKLAYLGRLFKVDMVSENTDRENR